MKKFLIILIMLTMALTAKELTKKELKSIFIFQKVSPTKYVRDFHYFWYDTCKTMKNLDNSISKSIEDMDKVLNGGVCNYVYNYSKIKYYNVVYNCYIHKIKFLDCLEKTNVLVEALEAK